jgi:nucleoside-diphosphate-sugar epimerase
VGVKTALVVGGTGPTGPHIVEGLVGRGYDVVVLHSGVHEVDFESPVEHVHVDPNFKEPLEEGMAARKWWDLIVFSYGRLRLGVEAAKGRTGRFIAIGGMNPASSTDPRVGRLGHPVNVHEEHLVAANDLVNSKIATRMTEARDALFAAHAEGHYDVTYLSYPANVYGPRAPGPREWCVIRRILDGRRALIVPDGGVAVIPRGFGPNVANAVLLAVEQPGASAGRHFAVADLKQYTLRSIIEGISSYMNYEWELLDVPYEFALPSRAFNLSRSPAVPSTSLIEAALGYRDLVPPEVALEITVDWLLENRPEPGGRVEFQIGAIFDYEKEDRIVDAWRRATSEVRATMSEVDFPSGPLPHVYEHPKAPGETWQDRRVQTPSPPR